MDPKIDYIEEGGLTYEVKTYTSGNKIWWYNDKFHRLNGPAVECTDGYKSYYINGKSYETFEDYKEAVVQIKIKEILNES